MKKNFLKIIFICLNIISFINTQSRLFNVTIYLDANENVDGPVTETSLISLCQKNSFIITTTHIFLNILESKKISKKKLAEEYDFYGFNHIFNLIIPKEYLENLKKKYNFDSFKKEILKKKLEYTPEEIFLGLKINSDLSLDEIDSYTDEIIKEIRKYSAFSPEYISKIFIQNEKEEIYPFWNIILNGHGSYPRNLDLTKPLPKIINSFVDATIVGLTINQFKNLIKFFSEKTKVNFLYYLTCYSFGLNLTLPFITIIENERLNITNSIKPNFIISTAGFLEQAVGVLIDTDECFKAKDKFDLTSFNFGKFFNVLEKYKNNKNNQSTKYNLKELAEILKTVMPYHHETDIEAIPQVLFPGTHKFISIPIDNTIETITDITIKTKLFEQEKSQKQDGKLIVNEKKVLLIYPNNISIDLEINPGKLDFYPNIISMIPGIALHRFKKLQYLGQYTFFKFLTSLELLNPISPKYFFIKELNIKNDEFLKLSTKEKKSEVKLENVFVFSTKNNTYILFIFENNIYYRAYIVDKNHIFDSLSYKKPNDVIIGNDFLNALYIYFYIQNKSIDLKKIFNFESLIQLIPLEDSKLLQYYGYFDKTNFVNKNYFKNKNLIVNPDEKLQGRTLLSYVAEEGYKAAIIQLLLYLGADVNFIDPKGKTPLYYSIINAHPAIVEMLLERGADPTKLFDKKNLKEIVKDKMAETEKKDPERYENYKEISDLLEKTQKHTVIETYFKKPTKKQEEEEEYVLV